MGDVSPPLLSSMISAFLLGVWCLTNSFSHGTPHRVYGCTPYCWWPSTFRVFSPPSRNNTEGFIAKGVRYCAGTDKEALLTSVRSYAAFTNGSYILAAQSDCPLIGDMVPSLTSTPGGVSGGLALCSVSATRIRRPGSTISFIFENSAPEVRETLSLPGCSCLMSMPGSNASHLCE